MEQATLRVQGMSCGHCVNAIEGNVGQLNGVQSVKVDLAGGKVDVAFDQGIISLAQISEAIEDQGYDIL